MSDFKYPGGRQAPKNLLKILFNSIALLGLFYTINADTVTQTGNGFWAPFISPLASLSRHAYEEERSLKDIIGYEPGAETRDPVYIFVYDASASIEPAPEEIDWHNRAIPRLNKYMIRSEWSFKEQPDPLGTSICKLKVADLLWGIRGRDLNFAVWKVGNTKKTGQRSVICII